MPELANQPSVHIVDYVRSWKKVPCSAPEAMAELALPPLPANRNLANIATIELAHDGPFDDALSAVEPAEHLKNADDDPSTTLYGKRDLDILFDLATAKQVRQIRFRALPGNRVTRRAHDVNPWWDSHAVVSQDRVPDGGWQSFDLGVKRRRYLVSVMRNGQEQSGISEVEFLAPEG